MAAAKALRVSGPASIPSQPSGMLFRWANLSIAVVLEVVTADRVCAEYEVYTVLLSLLDYVESYIELVILADRHTDLAAESLRECISHTTAENQVVNLSQQVLDDTDLGRNLRTTHDSCEWALDVAENCVNSLNLLLHQETEHLVILVERISDDSCRSVLAVSCTECVHYIYVSVRSELSSELLLTFLHLSLSSIVL